MALKQTGTCMQGFSGTKVHAAYIDVMIFQAPHPKAGKTRESIICLCTGSDSRGGVSYNRYQPATDASKITCKDCLRYAQSFYERHNKPAE